MPNTPVLATGEAMPIKYEMRTIMRTAWERYRAIRRNYAGWQIQRGIIDGSFASCLRTAWRLAKADRAQQYSAARIAVAMTGPNSARVSALVNQIDALPFKSLRYSTGEMRQRLEAELAALS
jgi:hypothetical protein